MMEAHSIRLWLRRESEWDSYGCSDRDEMSLSLPCLVCGANRFLYKFFSSKKNGHIRTKHMRKRTPTHSIHPSRESDKRKCSSWLQSQMCSEILIFRNWRDVLSCIRHRTCEIVNGLVHAFGITAVTTITFGRICACVFASCAYVCRGCIQLIGVNEQAIAMSCELLSLGTKYPHTERARA